ncbi:hypothetical protein [Catellatospora vulcania]|uniref:hypothetical protein n=1 Tax=Catellatospora vulcania TaxID=1460450 RepID=UPI0012D4C393|nr:hypothetical protein [Catellatospora vulcania]
MSRFRVIPSTRKILHALMCNPAAPEELVRQIIERADPSALRYLCHGRVLPPSVIDTMARHQDPRLREAAAEVENTPPETVTTLAGDPDGKVRRAVWLRAYAGMPVSEAAWRALSKDRRRIIRDGIVSRDDVSVAVKLLLADDPGLGDLVVLRYGTRTDADAVYQRILADGTPTAIAMALAATGRTPPPELIPLLVADPATTVVAARYDEAHAVRIANSPDVEVRRQLAADSHLPPAAADVLAADPDGQVRWALADNPAAPVTALRRLAEEGSRELRIRVFSNESTPEDLRTSMDLVVAANNHVPTVGWLAARCEDVELQARYARSPHVIFRRTAACCPHLPADAVAALAEDDDYTVRLHLAENHPDAPGELLVRMVPMGTALTAAAMMRRPQFPADALDRFTRSGLEQHRWLATYSDKLTGEQKARLAADPVPDIRELFDPAYPTAAELIAMLDDPDLEVRCRAAKHRNLPPAVMWQLFEATVTDADPHLMRLQRQQ